MITVIDYGMGNLRSVSKALEHLGGKVKVSRLPRVIKDADKLVLPGVGAFGDAMKELRSLELVNPIREHVLKKKPLLGICLGLQLLFKESEESLDVQGLGFVEGSVKRFRSQNVKIPHMGWNTVQVQAHPLLKGISDQSYFYFVHTYYGIPKDKKYILGSCEYGDDRFAAILGDDHIFATQFHPEKSQKAGLRILENFIKL